jgi:hypothetical protein
VKKTDEIKLTPRQEKFCLYYHQLDNASEAYRRSYSSENMKESTVNNRAYELLQKGEIKARLKQLQSKLQEKHNIGKDEAVITLSKILRADILNMVAVVDGRVIVKNTSDIPEDLKPCISSIKSTKFGIEINFYDKIQAIDRLAKLLGWDAPTKSEVLSNMTISTPRTLDDWYNKNRSNYNSDEEDD